MIFLVPTAPVSQRTGKAWLTDGGEPASIKEGAFVWCKFKLLPFWPAVVKSVRPKLKKASILLIDQPTIDTKRKG
ncbi:unnamed protein product [Boreogadus saida]